MGRCAVVPVLLPSASTSNLPVFFEGLTWVDLTVTELDPIDQLVIMRRANVIQRLSGTFSGCLSGIA
jgi:hypothetical protein